MVVTPAETGGAAVATDGNTKKTHVPDAVILFDSINGTDLRLYCILWSLRGKGRVASVSVNELGQLMRSSVTVLPWQAASASTIRRSLSHLGMYGLITNPDGTPVTTSSSRGSHDRRIQIKMSDLSVLRDRVNIREELSRLRRIAAKEA
jgi:hypothetical protein